MRKYAGLKWGLFLAEVEPAPAAAVPGVSS